MSLIDISALLHIYAVRPATRSAPRPIPRSEWELYTLSAISRVVVVRQRGPAVSEGSSERESSVVAGRPLGHQAHNASCNSIPITANKIPMHHASPRHDAQNAHPTATVTTPVAQRSHQHALTSHVNLRSCAHNRFIIHGFIFHLSTIETFRI